MAEKKPFRVRDVDEIKDAQESGVACFDDNDYRNSCSLCGYTATDNDACDSSITGSSYTEDGMCVANSGGDCHTGTVCHDDETDLLYKWCGTNCGKTTTDNDLCMGGGGTSYSPNRMCVYTENQAG